MKILINEKTTKMEKIECQIALSMQEETNISYVAHELSELLSALGSANKSDFDYDAIIKCYVKRLADLACGHRHYESSFRDAMQKVKEKASE